MKKNVRLIILIFLVAAATYIIANGFSKPGYQIVKLSGSENFCNYSHNGLNQIIGQNPEGISALPLFDDELIGLGIEGEDIFYRYRKSDGTNLVFRWDEFLLYLNDKVIFASIKEDSKVLEWIKEINSKGETTLRSISVGDSLPQAYREELKKLGEIKSDIGLILDNTRTEIDSLLMIFNPTWMVIQEYSAPLSNDLNKLELLWTNVENLDLNALANLSKLKYLFLSNNEPAIKLEKLKLPKQLKRLYLFECEVMDWDFLEDLSSLEHLSITGLDSLAIGKYIIHLNSLQSLSLAGCKNILDIETLKELSSLVRVSYPMDISQEDFNTFVTNQKDLEILDLIGTEHINSLEVLKDHPKIACLGLTETGILMDSLFDLQHLKYLAYSFDQENDSSELEKLKGILPNTLIVPSSGLCLGSGWLLLFIPFLLLMGVGLGLRKKRIR